MGMLADMEVSSLILMTRAHDDLAFAELVERYTPMLNKVVTRFHGPFVASGEAYSEACVALYRAALSYDISRTDITFGLYARICVYRRLCDLVGKELPTDLEAEEYDIAAVSYGNAIEDTLVSRERVQRALSAARKILSDYEYNVFCLYLKGYTTAEIAKELSKTAKSVDNAKARMMKHLRENCDSFSDF